MVQKGGRTGASAVGARLKRHDKIPSIRHGDFHMLGEHIERRAQRAHHRNGFSFAASYAVAHRYGVVLADDLAEVA